jgi:hypothetical protein
MHLEIPLSLYRTLLRSLSLIAFIMSLLIGALGLGPEHQDAVRLGVLPGSVAAAGGWYGWCGERKVRVLGGLGDFYDVGIVYRLILMYAL